MFIWVSASPFCTNQELLYLSANERGREEELWFIKYEVHDSKSSSDILTYLTFSWITHTTAYLCSADCSEKLKWNQMTKKAIYHFLSTCSALLSEPLSKQVQVVWLIQRVLPSQTLTNRVGLGLLGDSSSVVLLIRLDWCFPAPEVLTPVLSISNGFRASPCLDRMLIRTCFITANSWRITRFTKIRKSKTISRKLYEK